LLHEDPSTYVPWTKTIFIFVVFVVEVMLVVPWDCINVLFCCELAAPKYVDDARLAMIAILKQIRIEILLF